MERGTKGWSGADDGERKETELGCPMQNEIIIYCTHVLIKIKNKFTFDENWLGFNDLSLLVQSPSLAWIRALLKSYII